MSIPDDVFQNFEKYPFDSDADFQVRFVGNMLRASINTGLILGKGRLD